MQVASVTISARHALRRIKRQHFLRLVRSTPISKLRGRLGRVTLAELRDAGRPLLFSVLPRMVRGDGTTPKSLQASFDYLDQDHDHRLPTPVSDQRWSRALATSRRLALRRRDRRAR